MIIKVIKIHKLDPKKEHYQPKCFFLNVFLLTTNWCL